MLFKGNNKFSIIFGAFMIFILVGCGGGAPPGEMPGPDQVSGTGKLKHTVFSPLGDELESEESSYNSGTSSSTSETVIITRYRDFGLNYDSGSQIDSPEPYCRLGGSYTLNVINDARPPAALYENTVELYYCSTTKDILEMIQLPESWRNNQITIYCNDGANINFENINFEILTSNLNTYKVCIAKNLDLNTKNTIIFGFEVGNKVLDDNPGYLFDKASGTGQIVQGLTLNQGQSTKNLTETKTELFYTEHVSHCYPTITNTNDGDGGITQVVGSSCVTENKFDSASSCPGTIGVDTNGLKVIVGTAVGSCDEVTSLINAEYPNKLSFKRINLNNGLGQSVYEVTVPVAYEYTNLVYNNAKGEELQFEYDEHFTFYSLRDFDEQLSVPLSNVFLYNQDIPSFDLSRVALLRKFSDGRIIYGYESPARDIIQNVETSKPIYRIKIKSFTFTDNDCLQTLASYGAKIKSTYPTASDTVVCKSGVNREIFFNSDKIDSIYGQGTAFNLFKNVILDMN